VHEYGTMVKVKLRPIRRVACDGLLGAFGRVLAHASGPHVSADESNGNRHVFSECTTSVYTKCQQIQLEPRSVVDPSPMRGEFAEIGNRLNFALLLATLWPWKLRTMQPLFGSFKFQRLHKTSLQITAMGRYRRRFLSSNETQRRSRCSDSSLAPHREVATR
jgi:hypothetical protein